MRSFIFVFCFICNTLFFICSSASASIHNVKDYGAVGDGITDDTTEIQAAINAALNNKGTVFFPSGTYLVSSSLGISGSGMITLLGEGGQTTQSQIKQHTSFTGNLVNITSGYVKIKDLRILMNSSAGIAIYSTGESTLIQDCRIDGYSGNTNSLVYFSK